MAIEARRAAGWPALALLLNAFVWGVSWWPFRWLQAQGLHPLWATVMIYALAVTVISLLHPRAWRELFGTPVLWVLVLASGTTNASFNWGVTVGDVVRVVLLFYLMPMWAALLARPLLGERFSLPAVARTLMALGGAAIVLWPPGGGWPLPRTLAEWLGVLGGFTFALNNVMLRREAARSSGARALAMFLGGTLVAGLSALLLWSQGRVPAPPPPAVPWMVGALSMGALFLAGNMALQFGAARLPSSVTAVIMITEVLFASVSAVLLGAGVVTPGLLTGAALILGATLWSAL
jgi:drug/metabolite transporter (DMT)-like permease